MAAKQSYKIPYGLEQSYSDMVISLQSKDGSVGKVLPLLVVGTYTFSFLGCMFCVTKTFIGSMGNPLQIVLFIVLWTLLTVVLAQYDGTRRMNAQRVVTLLNYLPKGARYVFTRMHNDAGPFWRVLGIESITNDGFITFTDGTVGFMYRVVGSASILLFESDRDAIVQRVDNFYRKWDQTTEIIYVTTKEAQKVYRQMANLKRRYANLKNDDPDLRDLGEEQFRILRDYVGSEFKSIHQYMILKSENKEALRVANNILESEVESSALMIKQCTPLEYEDEIPVFQTIYQRGDFSGTAKNKTA